MPANALDSGRTKIKDFEPLPQGILRGAYYHPRIVKITESFQLCLKPRTVCRQNKRYLYIFVEITSKCPKIILNTSEVQKNTSYFSLRNIKTFRPVAGKY